MNLRSYLAYVKSDKDNLLYRIVIVLMIALSLVGLMFLDTELPLWQILMDYGGNLIFIIGMILAIRFGKDDSRRQIAVLVTISGILIGNFPSMIRNLTGLIVFAIADVFLIILAAVIIIGIRRNNKKIVTKP